MRIYLVDNVLTALQAVLADEKKIGGRLVEASDSFLVGYSSDTRLGIEIDDLQPAGWKCKYNVNRQEIPVRHIWSGSSHLLHCTFTIEMSGVSGECARFECCVRAVEVGVRVAVRLGVEGLLEGRVGELNEMKLIGLDRSRCWPKASRLICCQNLIRDFYK